MDKPKEEASKTFSLKITEQALQNIDQITGYIAFAKHEPLSAVHVGEMIFRTIDRIEMNPYIFRECREILTKNKIYRQAVCLSWLIIYKVKIPEIIILGVIHSQRKPSGIKVLRNKKIR